MAEKQAKRALLKDVAEKAGVSISLVSFVMNGKAKHYRVADEKAKMIEAIAKEMNYVPNLIAKGLRSGKTSTLGFIIADVSAPFFSKLARYIEDYAYSKGYSVIIGSTDEREDKSAKIIETMRSRGVDGFLVCASDNTKSQITELIDQSIPIVLLDRYFSDIDIVSVKLDNFNAAYEGVQHLIDQGFKNIALVTYLTNLEHQCQRVSGYEKAMLDHGFKPIVKHIRHSDVLEDTDKSLGDLFSSDVKPDAILFTAGQLCTKGIGFFKKAGLVIPKDVAVVSFDCLALFELFYSPITYIEQPIEQFAIKAVDILIDEIESGLVQYSDQSVVLQAQLVVNESSKK